MGDVEFVLTREQRDEILKAVAAVGRQVKELPTSKQWPAVWVIATNLAIIQSNLTNLPLLNPVPSS